MNYTENYRLNQWDPEDRILREDFNRDNANVESGLTTLKQGLKTETQSREAAVSAARQEATQAVNAAKQEASQALAAATGALESSKADKTALAQLQAIVDAMPFVKLREVTVGQTANQVDVDVSDIHLEDYAYIQVVPALHTDGEQQKYIMARLNGFSAGGIYQVQGDSSTYFMRWVSLSGENRSSCDFLVRDAGGRIHGIGREVTRTGDVRQSGSLVQGHIMQSSQMQTINFVGEEAALIQQGGKISIYGVKR